MRFRSSILALLLLLPLSACAATPEEIEFFEKKVRPVLVDHCVSCHGPEKQKAELRLDSREAILKGSDVGPVAVLGKPDESSLIKSIRHQGESKMPAKEPKLPEEEITALAEWVRMGMPWPEGSSAATASKQEKAAKEHWAFQPVHKPEPPAVQNSAWARGEIDRFILAKLESAGIAPAPEASRRTFIRRATIDLTGLPPTPEEISAFEKDETPEAYEKLVDRLLASPRYGERWGRYWLDVARYADTKGYVFQEERRYPYAYTYRDWVIRAFNEDLPYDRFISLQIAADLTEPKENTEAQAALGFLTLGRRFLNNQQDIIDDRIDLVTRGLMGLTVACARCHDHKFDPISQKDYYGLYGVFNSSKEPETLPLLADNRDEKTKAEYQKELEKFERKVEEFLEKRQAESAAVLSASLYTPVVLPTQLVRNGLNRAQKDKLRERTKKIEALNAGPLAPPRAMAIADIEKPHNTRVFIRGNPGRPGEEAPRRFVSIAAQADAKPFTKGSGRAELAAAIASRDNPLTARVIANRVWTHHFGLGLVRTPGDFGVQGEPPTHPELLDWLATRFMDDGWSLKKLHRTIMLSAAYRQSSETRPELEIKDPENRLVSRMNRRRLDFEAMRDGLLAAGGKLDLTMGGHSVELTKAPFPARRSVYGFIDRQNLPGVFRTFDFASPDATSPQRFRTTVPQQALFMMNSPFVMEQAQNLASASWLAPLPDAEKVAAIYRRILGRDPEPAETEAAVAFIARVSVTPEGAAPAQVAPWAKYAQVLLSSNEFAFVD